MVTAARKLKDAPWKKGYDKPRHILKSTDITLPTEVHLVKAMVFPVVVYGCESWSIKKAEHQELMLSNCGAGEGSRESLGFCKIQPLNPKGNQP